MAAPARLGLSAVHEALARELADRLEEAIRRSPGPSSHDDERLVTSSVSRSSTSPAPMPPVPHTYSAASSDQRREDRQPVQKQLLVSDSS
jgi:hypothetical protein